MYYYREMLVTTFISKPIYLLINHDSLAQKNKRGNC